MRFDLVQFLTSITGVSSLAATSLFVAKKYDLATAVFAALSIGATGVLWERYSRKAGSPLDLKVLAKKEPPEQDEIEFALTHSPYLVLAGLSFLLAKRKS